MNNTLLPYGFFTVLLLAVFLIPLNGISQNYGNEWINYNQQYFAVPIAEDGVYRIGFDVMASAGIPLGSFDPRSFQVYARGEQQPIIVSSEDTGNFQPGDHIEFYAGKTPVGSTRVFTVMLPNIPIPTTV
jgi:hypothetical protein